MLHVIARALALAIGAFATVNALVDLWLPGFDANLWWMDLRPLGPAGGRVALLGSGALLLAFALRPPERGARRALSLVAVAVLLVAAIGSSITYLALVARGAVTTRLAVPIPLSLAVAAALALILRSLLAGPARLAGTGHPGRVVGVVLVLLGPGFPLGQMVLFGRTDYRRPADAAVVFGARAYADGRPSDALADRVLTAVELYREGWAPVLVFSGGPGDGEVHEAEAMRNMAIDLGVPPSAILLDRSGLSTQATVEGTCALFGERGFRRVLAVSHAYHLPRVKLAFARAGREVYTVPARESYLLTRMPLLMAREVVAVGYYWMRPLLDRA